MRQLLPAVLAVLMLATPPSAWATGQAPDILILNGKTYSLFSNPLEDFYIDRSRPSFMIKPQVTSSGNWRGYTANWEIRSDWLYLTKIDTWLCPDRFGSPDDCKRPSLPDLFGDKDDVAQVRADWYSGDLVVPDGESLQYAHMGYGSIYERTITITVESGRVRSIMVADNRQLELPSQQELERKELEKMRVPKPAAN